MELLDVGRFAYTDRFVLGQIKHPKLLDSIYTLERPWIVNPAGPGGLPEKSCIPDGLYDLIPHTGPKFVNVFAMQNPELGVYVDALPDGQQWGRTSCLVHPANRVSELLGCTAVGLRWTIIDDEVRVLESRAALEILRTLVGPGDHRIRFRAAGGTE